MLNELNPAQKDKYVCFLICGIQDFIKRDEKAEGGPFGERNETGLGEPKRKMRSIYIVIIVPGGNPQGSDVPHGYGRACAMPTLPLVTVFCLSVIP